MKSDNAWTHDHQEIGVEFKSFFRNVFTSAHPSCTNLLQDLIRQDISQSINEELINCPSQTEIYRALFDMGKYKSSGPDDYVLQIVLGDCT